MKGIHQERRRVHISPLTATADPFSAATSNALRLLQGGIGIAREKQPVSKLVNEHLLPGSSREK